MIGFSAEYKDRRVDNLLGKRGYSPAKIFYSPIKVWIIGSFIILLMILSFLIPVAPKLLPFINTFKELIFCLVLVYGIISYMVAASLNNSFIVQEEKFIVVNPNFPFKKVRIYPIQDIQQIKMSGAPWMSLAILFGPLGNNYIEVECSLGKTKYYCAGLDLDCFDENLTKLTLDDLHSELGKENIPVVFQFDE